MTYFRKTEKISIIIVKKSTKNSQRRFFWGLFPFLRDFVEIQTFCKSILYFTICFLKEIGTFKQFITRKSAKIVKSPKFFHWHHLAIFLNNAIFKRGRTQFCNTLEITKLFIKCRQHMWAKCVTYAIRVAADFNQVSSLVTLCYDTGRDETSLQ